MKKFKIKARGQKESVKIACSKKIIEISKFTLENLYIKKKLSINQISKQLRHDRSIIKREMERYNMIFRSKSEVGKLFKKGKKIKKSTIEKLYYKDKLTQAQVGQKLNVHGNTILKLMKKYSLKTRKKVETSRKYPRYNFSKDKNEKAYLVGFRKGDLHISIPPSKNFLTISCTSTKDDQIDLFKKLFENYGYVWISKKRKDGNKVFLVRLNHSFDFLISKKDDIPIWILRSKDYFLSFLAGYTDAEGCIYIANDNVAGFKISSYDKKILMKCHQYLNKIGVELNSPKIHVKSGYKKTNGQIYKKDEWTLCTNKKSSLLKILQLLEPKLQHNKRLSDLKKATINILERNSKINARTFQ